MKTIILIALQLAASGGDAYCTHINSLSPRFREHNPIARPFVGSTGGQVVYFSGGAAFKISMVMLLRKRRHNSLADSAAALGIADNAEGIAFSMSH